MVRKYRCDSCKEIYLESELIKIIVHEGRPWHRCKKCIKKWGHKPRPNGYYTYITFEGVMGFEDPNKVVPYR